MSADANITWVALGYLLTSAIGLIIVGRLTDIFGRRWFFIVGNAIATVGSIVCATAPSIPALIAGETLIGVGASVQLSYACESQPKFKNEEINVADQTQLSLVKLCL
jgi:MFS family permease